MSGDREVVDVELAIGLILQRQIQAQLSAQSGRLVCRGAQILKADELIAHERRIQQPAVGRENVVRAVALRTVVVACAEQRSLEVPTVPIPAPLEPHLRIERYGGRLVGADGGNAVKASFLLQDDVHHDGLALHVDAGRAAADEIDPLDLRRRQTRQDADQIVGLAGRAPAVDQDIARGTGKAAQIASVVEHEPRHAADRVICGVYPHRREEGGWIARDGLAGRIRCGRIGGARGG